MGWLDEVERSTLSTAASFIGTCCLDNVRPVSFSLRVSSLQSQKAPLISDSNTLWRSRLTLLETQSSRYAFLTTVMSLISSSPAGWLLGTYSEPLYAFFALRGMIFCHYRQFLFAAVSFALATCFRANGILLSGYLAWGIVVKPFLTKKEVRV